jgi:hypothetical protein
VIGDSQHGDVVEAEETILGAAAGAGRLRILDFRSLIAEVADETPKVWILLVRAPELFNDLSVVEAESREVVDELHVGREPSNEPVVELSRPRHEPGVFVALFHPDYDLVAFPPFSDELGDELGGVLQVGDAAYDRVASRFKESVIWRADVAEVAVVNDHLDPLVRRRKLSEDLDRFVR